VSLTDEDVERFVEAEANKNIQRKMNSDVTLLEVIFAKWKRNKTYPCKTYRHAELDTYLSRFLLSVRKKSSDEFEPTKLRGIIASVDHYLKNLRYSESIIERTTFDSWIDWEALV